MTSSVVLYEEAGAVRVLYPTDRPLEILTTPDGVPAEFRRETPEELTARVAKKDVPAGLPYWVVPTTSIPTDRSYRSAWVLDKAALGAPSGVGESV